MVDFSIKMLFLLFTIFIILPTVTKSQYNSNNYNLPGVSSTSFDSFLCQFTQDGSFIPIAAVDSYFRSR